MLVEYHLNYGYSSEVDLFITQTVLKLLCLKNDQTAIIVFRHYIKIHPNIEKKEFHLFFIMKFKIAIEEK
jgi:hypothetical protein